VGGGIGAGGGAGAETAVRVEYDQNGKASVVVRSKVQKTSSVEAPFGSFNAERSESFEVEASYDLPPGFDVSRLKDPAKAKAAVEELAAKSKTKSLKVRYSHGESATSFGNGAGRERKTEVEVTPDQARKIAKAWREQGARGAARELGNTPVTVSDRTYVQGGAAGGVSVNGGGGKAGVVAQRDESVEVRKTTGNREAGVGMWERERDEAGDLASKSQGPEDPLSRVATDDPLAPLEAKEW
jgi:hypothetical protein